MSIDNLTTGSVWRNLFRFSIPYLIACFLQNFYGLADLFITGQFHGADTITAVSVGSQIMHMVTVVIVGLAMGSTVIIGQAVGAKEHESIKNIISNTLMLFLVFGILLSGILLIFVNQIIHVMSVPEEAVAETKQYLCICFVGILCITAYNILASIFRGLGDSKTPMYFVAMAGILNIGLDYIFIGVLHKGAMGAALATVIAQAICAILLFVYAYRQNDAFHLTKNDFVLSKKRIKEILRIGVPVSCQDGFIQVAFLVITVIANRRGVEAAAAVGIVEKLISFMFLVPSAMLSAVSAICSQCIGAKEDIRGRKTLGYGVLSTIVVGAVFVGICLCFAEPILGLFTKEEPLVILMGAQYLRAYVWDCMIAGVHFCFSGYFCACGKSYLSFLHNIISIILIRIPGAYIAAKLFPQTLFPMGLAAPLGSLLSAIICIVAYLIIRKKQMQSA